MIRLAQFFFLATAFCLGANLWITTHPPAPVVVWVERVDVLNFDAHYLCRTEPAEGYCLEFGRPATTEGGLPTEVWEPVPPWF